MKIQSLASPAAILSAWVLGPLQVPLQAVPWVLSPDLWELPWER